MISTSSTDFSLWGSVSKPGLFPRAKIDGPHTTENSLQSKISASSNGTPQTEVCATKTWVSIRRPIVSRNLSARGWNLSVSRMEE